MTRGGREKTVSALVVIGNRKGAVGMLCVWAAAYIIMCTCANFQIFVRFCCRKR